MKRISRADRGVDASEQLLVAATDADAAAGLSSWTVAMPTFFVGWVCLGLLLAAAAQPTARNRRELLALGVGLGPLAVVVALESRWRRGASRPLVVAPGVDHGGELDVLVLVQDRSVDVGSVAPTLEAVASDVGNLTLGRTLPDLWLGEDDGEAIDEAALLLLHSRDLVPIPGASLVVFPDTSAAEASRRFSGGCGKRLVLFATGDTAPTQGA